MGKSYRTRKRYQNGTLEQRALASGEKYWMYRWSELGQGGKPQRKGQRIGSLDEYPTRARALKASELLRLRANDDTVRDRRPTFNAVITRYELEEMPERRTTARGYRSLLKNHIGPKWGSSEIPDMKPMHIREWLKALPLAGKTKSNVKALMSKLFDCAMLWEYMPTSRNPMELVTVAGMSKREKQPTVLSFEQFSRLLECLTLEPHRTMVLLAGATGLRRSELVALKWGDINWQQAQMHIQRSWVDGWVDETKTPESDALSPLDPFILGILAAWRAVCPYPADTDYLFASPYKDGEQPYYPHKIIEDVNTMAKGLGLPRITWHPLRHSYRSWLDATGASLGTMKGLMRHKDIRTTMNVYGHAFEEQKRAANSRVADGFSGAKHVN